MDKQRMLPTNVKLGTSAAIFFAWVLSAGSTPLSDNRIASTTQNLCIAPVANTRSTMWSFP
jgi:hypothetical protein